MDFPDGETPDIDELLGQYERELGSYATVRGALQPIIQPLWVELSTFLDDPDAEEERLPMILILRSQYFHLLQELGPAIAEFASIRGAGERLWMCEPYMSDVQWQRFGQLQAVETSESDDVQRFDQVHKALRPKLLVLSEMTSD